jgi:hypothetical protein
MCLLTLSHDREATTRRFIVLTMRHLTVPTRHCPRRLACCGLAARASQHELADLTSVGGSPQSSGSGSGSTVPRPPAGRYLARAQADVLVCSRAES